MLAQGKWEVGTMLCLEGSTEGPSLMRMMMMMTMTMHLGYQGWVKALLLPWPGRAAEAQEKWLQLLGALQLLDNIQVSVQHRLLEKGIQKHKGGSEHFFWCQCHSWWELGHWRRAISAIIPNYKKESASKNKALCAWTILKADNSQSNRRGHLPQPVESASLLRCHWNVSLMWELHAKDNSHSSWGVTPLHRNLSLGVFGNKELHSTSVITAAEQNLSALNSLA